MIEFLTKTDLDEWGNHIVKTIKELMKESDKPQTSDVWLKTNEACTLLNCSKNTLYSLRGEIETSKPAGIIYWNRNSIQDYLNKHRSN